MLDSVIKLTEKATELLKYRSERRAKRFEKLVEPMFQSLKAVHKDYALIFEDARCDLEAGRPLAEVAATLRKRRLEEEAERRAALAQARQFAEEPSLADLEPFFSAVVRYFGVTPFSRNNTPSSVLLGALEDAARSEPSVARSPGAPKGPPTTPTTSMLHAIAQPESARTREQLKTGAEMGGRMLLQNWEQIAAAYATLRAASVD
jgi:hypothetical protein